MFLRPTLILLGLIIAVVVGLVIYDQSSSCDPGPITRGVKDLLDERYATVCR